MKTIFASEVEIMERQAKARQAWSAGKRLIVGAYYAHCNGLFVRRVEAVAGKDVYWRDRFGSGLCVRDAFVRRVTGPL